MPASINPQKRYSARFKALDRIRPWPAAGIGLAIGVAAGLGFALQIPFIAGPVFLVLLGLSGWLAFSGEPVAVIETKQPHDPLWADIPGGRFLMGSPEGEEGRRDNERPVHEVTVSAFRCMRIPVTQHLYRTIMADEPNLPDAEFDETPVVNISWFDAVAFCNRWSEKEGLIAYYRIEDKTVEWDASTNGYRLLTEGEWEYACRAGSKDRWSFGSNASDLSRYAWFGEGFEGKAHPVAKKLPNQFGLYDMHGNVWEWCWDWRAEYPKDRQVDPKGPRDGKYRVLRGGSFGDSAEDLLSAFRYGNEPENASWIDGFRCARGPRRES